MSTASTPALATAPLGETGHAITRLGFGAAHIASGLGGAVGEDESIALVHRLLDLGITYMDTAPLYGAGESERRLGRALKSYRGAGQAFIATKVGHLPDGSWDYSYDATMRTIEASLESLGQAILHSVQIHEIQEQHWDQVWAADGVVAALQQAKEQRLIGHIGVTGSDGPVVARAIETGVFETVLIWRTFHLLDQAIARTTLHLAAQRHMAVIVGTPFAGSILATGTQVGPRPEAGPQFMYRDAPTDTVQRVAALQEVCERYGVPLRAAALQFILRDQRVSTIIPGATSPDQAEQLVEAVSTPIPAALWDELAPLVAGHHP